jgi:hypothetical protein
VPTTNVPPDRLEGPSDRLEGAAGLASGVGDSGAVVFIGKHYHYRLVVR